MKVLISTTYFHPYSSGLSVYAYRLAEGLADLGHDVIVLTSQHAKVLPKTEPMGKFYVVRVPIFTRLSKGVLMPGLAKIARQWIAWADVVNLHLPQFEAIILSKIAKELGKPVIATYHCDLVMNGGPVNKLAGKVTTDLGIKVLDDAAMIVQNSLDYAEHSPVLKDYLDKVVESPTPIKVKKVSQEQIDKFRIEHGISEKEKIIGLAGRVASEKGYEYLAMAFPSILEKFPKARIIHAGAWKNVVGESAYQRQVEGFIRPFGDRWQSFGFLSDEDFETFFAICDVLVFTSLNATESYGIVQLEAMTQGTPIVASDLPGVRLPVKQTGLGKIVPARDSEAIASAVTEILSRAEKARIVPTEFLSGFQQDAVAARYEAWMELLVPNA